MAKSKKTGGHKAKMASHLVNVLSDTYVLAIKLHGYHWNVTGPAFYGLHKQFEDQYKELIEAADELAERLRVMEVYAPGSMELFLQNSAIKEASVSPISASAMIKDLLKSHEILRARLAEAAEVADDCDDDVSEGMLIDRLAYHDKVIWMLRSQLA